MMTGWTAICAVAVDERLIVWPPKNDPRNGVTSLNWPRTVTAITLPSASEHGLGVQATSTSPGVTFMSEPVDSLEIAHMIRLMFASHGASATYEVGWRPASRAPARAMFETTMREWKRRPRSAAVASSSSRTGMISASSTIV